MPKPITPFCGCDTFVTDTEGRVLLIQRSDNGLWALPGGCQDLNETAQECAIRECREESGYDVIITRLLGVWSSTRYEYVNYPWKDNQFTHVLFQGAIVGGAVRLSEESTAVSWFRPEKLPDLSDGHAPRIEYGFAYLKNPLLPAYFE
jgi:8-oxo-dGTP pyrophosphatase MutT (NUDIX family)